MNPTHPTPDTPTTPTCYAEHPDGHLCTHPIGHDGDHAAAGIMGNVYRRWPEPKGLTVTVTLPADEARALIRLHDERYHAATEPIARALGEALRESDGEGI